MSVCTVIRNNIGLEFNVSIVFLLLLNLPVLSSQYFESLQCWLYVCAKSVNVVLGLSDYCEIMIKIN